MYHHTILGFCFDFFARNSISVVKEKQLYMCICTHTHTHTWEREREKLGCQNGDRPFFTVTICKPYIADLGPWYVWLSLLDCLLHQRCPLSVLLWILSLFLAPEDNSLGLCYVLRIHFSLAGAGHSESVLFWLIIHELSLDLPLLWWGYFPWIFFQSLCVHHMYASKFFSFLL